jgi:uncharacterized repeat protein (TIGR01451 family)
MKSKQYQTNSFSTTFLTRTIRGMLVLAATFALAQLAGAASYTWANSGNWSSSTNWTPNTGAGGPLSTDTVIFGNTAASSSPTTVNNIVDSGFAGTIANLTNSSVASSPYVYVVTQIPSGKTLTVSNSVFVGGQNESTAYATFANMTGGGTFKVTGSSLIVQNYGSAGGANNCAYLDLSGLTNFVYNNTNGTIGMESYVPGNYTSGSQGTRQGGSMILAAGSNNITAAAINLGQSGVAQAGPSGPLASGIASQLTLGPGTNIINVTNFTISAQKNAFTVSNSGGGLRIRGRSGADSDTAVNITIGNRNVGGGTGNTVGSMMLNGCKVDIKAGSLIVGENIGGAPGAGIDLGSGMLQFDNGTVSANKLLMAYNTSANNGTYQAQCVGTIDVGANGTLLIGAGQLFALATATSTGPSTGTLIISNGLVNCQGPIVMGTNGGTLNGSIVFLTGGTLNMGPNSYVGTLTNPVTTLTLTNCTLSVSIPSVAYTNICVQNLNWPVPDNNLTISLAAMPAGITNGTVLPFLNYSTSMTGTFNTPNLILPAGYQGYLSLVGNASSGTIFLTITNGGGWGPGGVPNLLNPNFGLNPRGTDWTAVGGASIVSTSSTYPNTGSCTVDTRNVVSLVGTNVAKLTGSFVVGGSTNSWSQSVPVDAGSTFTLCGYTYVAHEDIMSGADSFHYELDFRDINGVLLAAYESGVVTNLTCGGPNMIPLDAWDLMPLTNQMQVTGGINTGMVISNVTTAIVVVPPQTVTAQFKAIFIQANATDTGSVYFSGPNLGFLLPPVPPTISGITPNLITLCTNKTLTSTANSTATTISSFQVVATTTTLGGTITNTATYTVGSGLTATGLGTASATVSLPLATNTIYVSVVVSATDADGVTVSSTATFDTLVPSLVIEASDFNYTTGVKSGMFIDTPPNGGLALYANLVGTQGIDENKVGRLAGSVAGEVQAYYRTNDAVIMNAAAPNTGIPPTGTEQKFITSLANGDTTDFELEVGYNSPGDWLNYTRTIGATGSAPAGFYNVWCYVATSGTGPQATFSQVTSDPTQPNQTTNFLGTFGSSTFSDASYNTFMYVPLLDNFGAPVTLSLTNGQYTFKSTVAPANPNLGFYLFVPAVPIYTPVFLSVYPNKSFEPTSQFTFTVSPAQGAPISTNGIGLILNGVTITSGLTFTSVAGGDWTVTYAIQSNAMYTVAINVTNTDGLYNSYSGSFDTMNLNNYHWMAADYDFSTNNGTSSGGTVGNGWTGGLFIDNPVPTGDTNAPSANMSQLQTGSYFGYPTGFYPGIDPAGVGAVAQQGVDINWQSNTNQDPVAGQVANSIYRGGFDMTALGGYSDGVGTQVAGDSFVLPEFIAARTNFNDPLICEFNIGYFYATNWLNYTRTYPSNTYNIVGRLAAGSAFSAATLSMVTSGVGTSNQTTRLLGTFSDPSPAGYQSYHWITLQDTNGNNAVVQLGGKTTLRLTAPANASSSGGALNPLFFMLVPATAAAPSADVGIGKSALTTVSATSNLSYTISVTNFGPSSASSVVVTDALPSGVKFVSASGNGLNNLGLVTWNLGTLAKSQVTNLTLVVTAPAGGSLTNVASVSTLTADPNMTNNVSPSVVTVVTPSSFAVSASNVGGNIQISISTQIGVNYTLWHAGSLPAASWTMVGTIIAGDGTVHVVPLSLTGSQGYYRVSAQ